MPFRLLAVAVVLVHLGYVAFLVGGGFLAWRWPRLLRFHLAALATAAAIFLGRLDCPLTVLEKDLWRRAGEQPYAGGFIAHYLVDPFYAGGMTGGVRVALTSLLLAAVALGGLGCWSRRSVRGL